MDVAEDLAKKQKEISIAEFFEKNKQILGFDSPQKALVMAVKEAVDNSLDACEDARILPEINVTVERIDREEYKLTVEDNGPGIVRREVPKVFGQFLYGSRFHAVRQTRGQQGIGISAVVLYGQLTTGKPVKVETKIASEDVGYTFELFIDTMKNRANVLKEEPVIVKKKSGVKIEIHLKGKYTRGRQSVIDYLQNTAIVNPHATITFSDPDGLKIKYERAWEQPRMFNRRFFHNTPQYPFSIHDISHANHKLIAHFRSPPFSRNSAPLMPGLIPSSLAFKETSTTCFSSISLKSLTPVTLPAISPSLFAASMFRYPHII